MIDEWTEVKPGDGWIGHSSAFISGMNYVCSRVETMWFLGGGAHWAGFGEAWMTTTHDYYEILQVSPKADEEIIQAAYRREPDAREVV
jgi:hypothetical protein